MNIFLTTICLFFSLLVFSQKYSGFQVFLNSSKISNNEEAKSMLMPGFGYTFLNDFSDKLGFETGVNFNFRGYKIPSTETASNKAGKFDNVSLGYLEVPANVKFRYQQFIFTLGLNLSYGIFGVRKYYETYKNEQIDDKSFKVFKEAEASYDSLVYYSSFRAPDMALTTAGPFNRMLVGLNLGAGYQIDENTIVSLNYYISFSKIRPKDYNTESKFRSFGLSIIYFFSITDTAITIDEVDTTTETE